MRMFTVVVLALAALIIPVASSNAAGEVSPMRMSVAKPHVMPPGTKVVVTLSGATGDTDRLTVRITGPHGYAKQIAGKAAPRHTFRFGRLWKPGHYRVVGQQGSNQAVGWVKVTS